MKIIKLEENQRKELAKASYDIGKLIFAAFVIGQLALGKNLNLTSFSLGVMAFILTFMFANNLNKGVK